MKYNYRTGTYIKPPRNEKDMSACGIFGIINKDRKMINGLVARRAMANMHDRGNGLGGGIAAYGIYPQYKDLYAIHIMYDSKLDIPDVENYLGEKMKIEAVEDIPLARIRAISDHPFFRRYFVSPDLDLMAGFGPDDFVVKTVMQINSRFEHAFVVSSGKNMGAFKGVGFPEDIVDFFKLEEYEGYMWLAHNRFPTNTPGWWGGAHPFCLLDWSIVHNGEISSYGINKRYLEANDYVCSMMTDTEVITYLLDFLVRRHGLSLQEASQVLAPPFWKDIDGLPENEKTRLTELRSVYGSASLNGPFAFLMGFSSGMMGLNDRVKLRPLLIAQKGKTIFMSSEEAAIRIVSPELDWIEAPIAGSPVIALLE